MDMNRRSWLQSIGAVMASGVVLMKTPEGEVKARFSSPDKDQVADSPSGQIVDDIIIGTFGMPYDEHYLVAFYKASAPKVTVLLVPLNMRATFRWVAIPGREIRLKSGDRLCWRVTYGTKLEDEKQRPWVPIIYMRGQDLQTGKIVVNQCEFEV